MRLLSAGVSRPSRLGGAQEHEQGGNQGEHPQTAEHEPEMVSPVLADELDWPGEPDQIRDHRVQARPG